MSTASQGSSAGLLTEVLTRGARLVRSLLSVHLELAQQEAAKDLSRLLTGVALLVVGAILALGALFLVDGAAVVAMAKFTQLTLWASFLVVAAINVAIAGLLALVGVQKLKQPVMKKTRGLAKQTAQNLLGQSA